MLFNKSKSLLLLCGMVVLLCGMYVAGEKYHLMFNPNHSADKRNGFRDLNAYTMVKETKMTIMVGEPMAQVHYEETINKTGWATLSLSTNSDRSDEEQAFAAGFVEGYVTGELFQNYWIGFKQYTFDTSQNKQLDAFLDGNFRFMKRKIAEAKNSTNPEERTYWYHVSLILDQVEGMYAGYLKVMSEKGTLPVLSLADLFKFQLDGDIDDLSNMWSPPSFETMSKFDLESYAIFKTKCSAFVKYSKDRRNLFLTHATWDTFQNMLRVYKHYRINFKNVPAKLVSFSSAPGWLVSVDDFYITSAGLVITETSNNIFNLTLYQKTTPETLLYWIRNIVANRLATSAKEWTDIFAKYNSGTYNNQWIVLDTKRFVPGATRSDPELLYILEQIPGDCKVASVSHFLDTSYWASYNIPYFPYIYNISGYPSQYKKFGDFWSYENCPRAKIFRRDAPYVGDLEGVKRLIRKNDYQSDPFSDGDACHQIAARCDLNPPNKRSQAFGAIDAKVTDIQMAKTNTAVAQSGPTHDQQPVFTWNSQWDKVNIHTDQPVSFGFDWVEMTPQV
ncbi:hypothetical protein FDP41_002766 [Naegleria fowleri]|uniref:Phospholipase B-like n=1 Tax=Naegleria fowleri TaxID=5763 RepID=A0A6A5BV03_NAEFO|nr:uncharacterized protein FDP41_002766 [Naegleria fowleri]KAF0978251.1 hypothetical protein FDP41_002766 [Naegleria fowleri]CAG4710120.1 unnamed protein product [Naegleria fowleri]